MFCYRLCEQKSLHEYGLRRAVRESIVLNEVRRLVTPDPDLELNISLALVRNSVITAVVCRHWWKIKKFLWMFLNCHGHEVGSTDLMICRHRVGRTDLSF
jgi:hypothetical protein